MWLSILFAVTVTAPATAAAALAVTTDGVVVSTTNPTYASWTIDASYNRGFVHTAFNNTNLLAAATSLSPSTLRFGGSGNDYLHYGPPSMPCKSNNDSDTSVCLNMSHWDNLYNFVEKSGTDFLFAISFDMPEACTLNESYIWAGSTAQKQSVEMIKHIQSQSQSIWGYELGNEVNNRYIKCNLNPAQQAAAFTAFAAELATLYPDATTRPKLCGPDVGYLESETWLRGFLTNLTAGGHLHAVTYHVYSEVNRANYNDAQVIDHALTDMSWYVPLVRELAPAAQIWAGEDGPIGGGEDGTCGGEAGRGGSACGTYATVLWYANDLGSRALHGFSQYQRQDLLGGRYGLLGIPHDNEALGERDAVRINPDFWINFLWKRLMGNGAVNVTLAVSSPPHQLLPGVRAYAHCGPPPSKHAPASVVAAGKAHMGMVLINLGNASTTVDLDIASSSGQHAAWTLTPADGPFGERALLNGKPLQAMLADGKAITNIPIAGIESAEKSVRLPPISVTFVAARCPDHRSLH